MRNEPLFIRYANGHVEPASIIQSFLDSNQDEKSNNIALEALKSPPDLTIFRKDFKSLLVDIIDNGINKQAINYIDNYMKPSLEELVSGGTSRAGEKRQVILKAKDTPWVEAIVCYNLTLYIKMYGISEIKKCPVCSRFFSHKGKYAKYCSDICKTNGGVK